MTIKEIWTKTGSWIRAHKPSSVGEFVPDIDGEGLISQHDEADADEASEQSNQVVVKAVQPKSKAESLEKLQAGFDKLVGQLEGINSHLNRQVAQNEDLMGRMEQLPKLVESFPAVVENQKQLTEQLFEQLKEMASKDEQFIDAVDKIPTETAKQTDALVNIDHQLAAAADTDVQMADTFNKFHETLAKLNESTIGHTDSVMQMSRTFAASDRYLKYIMSRQRKSFMWVFWIGMGVCVSVILILAGIIIYLKQQ
jgi:methyl-accepting chemotaxis protein